MGGAVGITPVWPNGFGSDEGLTRLVSVLRKTLSTDHGINDAVATVPKLGYRFDADIRDAEEPPQSATAPSRAVPLLPEPDPPAERPARARKWRLIWVYAFGAVVVVTGVIALLIRAPGSYEASASGTDALLGLPDRSAASLAVLPIESLTPDKTRAFLADGMMRDLTAQLSRVLNLRVAPYSSARVFAGGQMVLRIDLTDAELGQPVWTAACGGKDVSLAVVCWTRLPDGTVESVALRHGGLQTLVK